jgi:hypothetical protein
MTTLEHGTLYHVEWAFPGEDRGGSFYGTYARREPTGVEVFWQPSRKRFVNLRYGKRILSATRLDASAMMERLPLYAKVTIAKYGSTYTGTVVGRKRTRVCVAFRTNGGQDKEQWFRVLDVEPLTKPATA